MPNFTYEQIREAMNNPEHIRNMSVIAHVDHSKTTLTDSLVAKAGIIASHQAGVANNTDSHVLEKAKGITIKSTGISLYYETDVVNQKDKEPFLINLIDSPGHVDFSSEVTAALRVTDGALVVVDYVDGVCVQTETVLRQALGERIKPVVFINKIDRGILELQVSGEEMYQKFNRVIEEANVVIATYESQEEGHQTLQVSPADGTVAFGSALFGWAFTLSGFARVLADKFKLDVAKLTKRLWGDNYFNPATKKIGTDDSDGKGGKLARFFVQFVMCPVISLCKAIMEGTPESRASVDKMLQQLNIKLDSEEKTMEGKHLFKAVFQKWLNAADALLEMIIMKLPSPKQAQAYRAANLYEGPIDDPCGQSIAKCDQDGPTMVFISKMVPSGDSGQFYAFGRVFGGTISTGQKVRVMGPNYVPGGKTDLNVVKVARTVIMMGKNMQNVQDVPCGNTVGLLGIDKYLVKQGTISSHEDAHTIKSMKFSVSPVVRVAVEVTQVKDLPKLVEGLRRLSRADPLVQCYTEESGEHIIAGCGELHVDICLHDLERDFAKCPIKRGDPVVSYRETVTQKSSKTCLSKSPNNHNRMFCTAEPLGIELALAIEEDKVSAKMDAKDRKNILRDEFEWDPNDAMKIWCFGPDTTGPNVLVDVTKGVQYLREVEDSVNTSFNWVTKEGVMTEENLRGIRFNIEDVKLHTDAIHRGAGQIIPASRRCFYASQLTAKPAFQEPIFEVSIQCPEEVKGNVYKCLSQRRGQVQSEEPVIGTPLCNMKAFLPVSESFGFDGALRLATGGHAFPQCTFDHWADLNGDPMDPTSKAGELVIAIRKRKGLSEGIPSLDTFFDKL